MPSKEQPSLFTQDGPSPRKKASAPGAVVLDVRCKNLLNQSEISDYSFNCYTGCTNGCVYCYARFMQRFHPHEEPWGQFVDVKVNSREALARQLRMLVLRCRDCGYYWCLECGQELDKVAPQCSCWEVVTKDTGPDHKLIADGNNEMKTNAEKSAAFMDCLEAMAEGNLGPGSVIKLRAAAGGNCMTVKDILEGVKDSHDIIGGIGWDLATDVFMVLHSDEDSLIDDTHTQGYVAKRILNLLGR